MTGKAGWSYALIRDINSPANHIIRSELAVVIRDKYPKARHHFLVLPWANIDNVYEVRSFLDYNILVISICLKIIDEVFFLVTVNPRSYSAAEGNVPTRQTGNRIEPMPSEGIRNGISHATKHASLASACHLQRFCFRKIEDGKALEYFSHGSVYAV